MKIFTLLRTFSTSDLTHFKKFLNSPYFNNNIPLRKYFDIIRKKYPDFEDQSIKDEKVFKRLYPKKDFRKDKQLMHKLRSELLNSAKEFLQIEHIKGNKILGQRILGNVFIEKEYAFQFPQDYSELSKLAKKSKSVESTRYAEQFHFQFDEYFKPELQELKNHDKRYSELEKSFKRATLFSKLILAVESLNLSRVQESDPKMILTEKELMEIELLLPKSDIRVKLYMKLYDLLLKEIGPLSLSQYLDAQRVFVKNLHHFHKNELPSIAQTFINYTVQAARTTGNKAFMREQLKMYLMSIKKSIFIRNNKIHPGNFYNTVSIAVALNRKEFTKRFINDNEKYLPHEQKKSILALSRGTLHFKSGEFWDAYDELETVHFDKGKLLLTTESIKVRTYFELLKKKKGGKKKVIDPTLVIKQIKHFGDFIAVNGPKDKDTRKAYLNLVDWLKRLMKLWSNSTFSDENFQNLMRELENEEKLVARLWVKSKLKELKERKS